MHPAGPKTRSQHISAVLQPFLVVPPPYLSLTEATTWKVSFDVTISFSEMIPWTKGRHDRLWSLSCNCAACTHRLLYSVWPCYYNLLWVLLYCLVGRLPNPNLSQNWQQLNLVVLVIEFCWVNRLLSLECVHWTSHWHGWHVKRVKFLDQVCWYWCASIYVWLVHHTACPPGNPNLD
jgi:hypothetical protein